MHYFLHNLVFQLALLGNWGVVAPGRGWNERSIEDADLSLEEGLFEVNDGGTHGMRTICSLVIHQRQF